MADKLIIRINAEGGTRTLSKFEVTESAPVTIYNDASTSLNLKFEGASPLCQGGNPQSSIDIGGKEKGDYKVCDGTAGLGFRYTATVSNATAENQVLVVAGPSSGGDSTNPIFFPETWIGFVAGVIITWGIFAVLRRNKPTTNLR